MSDSKISTHFLSFTPLYKPYTTSCFSKPLQYLTCLSTYIYQSTSNTSTIHSMPLMINIFIYLPKLLNIWCQWRAMFPTTLTTREATSRTNQNNVGRIYFNQNFFLWLTSFSYESGMFTSSIILYLFIFIPCPIPLSPSSLIA